MFITLISQKYPYHGNGNNLEKNNIIYMTTKFTENYKKYPDYDIATMYKYLLFHIL